MRSQNILFIIFGLFVPFVSASGFTEGVATGFMVKTIVNKVESKKFPTTSSFNHLTSELCKKKYITHQQLIELQGNFCYKNSNNPFLTMEVKDFCNDFEELSGEISYEYMKEHKNYIGGQICTFHLETEDMDHEIIMGLLMFILIICAWLNCCCRFIHGNEKDREYIVGVFVGSFLADAFDD